MSLVNASGLAAQFEQVFGTWPRVFSAPGRVNLIGEHTDYNDGFVLPIAINRRTYVAGALAENLRLQVHSLDLNESAEVHLSEARVDSSKPWVAYVAGPAWILARQHSLRGVDMMIASDVPIGGGLSSSAALEVATCKAIAVLSEIELAPLSLALTAHDAENIFTGARVGLMDQMAATFGWRGHALLIDCRSLELQHIPTDKIEGAAIVVCNTKIKHELASSPYNQRRKECEAAVSILQERMPVVKSLRDVSVADYLKFAGDLPEPIRRRARHVVTENDRTLQAAEAIQRGDLVELGSLMKLSHESLRDDYEVSCRELDVIVELAWSYPGVFGARMTGGGFGGCSVNLVRRERLNDFCDFITKRYEQATQLVPDIFVVTPADGVREEQLTKN